jgi:anti-sigma factor RsiW
MKHRPGEERLLTSYLLGEASELEQSLLETNYFRDPRFYELLLAVEEELICDYLNGFLSPHEWRQFEQHFLKSARRRQKCEELKRLLTCVAHQPQAPTVAPVHKRKAVKPAARARRGRQMFFL